jgi:hypothetical protein
MRSPLLAAPVTRGLARAYQLSSLQQQACNWLTCAEDILKCAAACYPNPLNPGCISCLGPAWNDCKGCFGG